MIFLIIHDARRYPCCIWCSVLTSRSCSPPPPLPPSAELFTAEGGAPVTAKVPLIQKYLAASNSQCTPTFEVLNMVAEELAEE